MSLTADQLRHEALLQRVATGLLKTSVYPSLAEAYKAVRAILLEQEQINSPAQLNRITKAISASVTEIYTAGWQEATKELQTLAVYEAGYYAELIGKWSDVELAVPGSKSILDYVSSALMVLGEGDRAKVGAWAEFVNTSKDELIQQYNNLVKVGYTRGATVQEMARSLRTFNDGLAKQQAEALARTGVMHYAQNAREAMAADNRDIIDKRYFIALLDNRTTLGCRSLHGRTWALEDDSYVRLPRHFRCRSSYVYLLEGQDKPIGMTPAIGSGADYSKDGDEKPTYKGKKDIGTFKIEQVPADITPDAWLRQQSREFVIDSIGKKRAELFLDGGLKIESMTDTFGNPLSLDELRERDSKAFAKAGL
jgi:SPP1 gp7 family putative phage head morphogenesis protein